MDTSYGQHYRALYEKHWWWRARERYVLDVISELGVQRQADILDIGCGDGLFFDALSKFGTPFGIEPDKTLLSDSSWRKNIYNVSFEENFQMDRQFDFILMLDVLEHLDDDLDALHKAVGLLNPNAKILVTVPALMSAWTAHDTVNHHRRRYNRSEFESLFRSAGLRVIFCRYYFVWTYVPKLLLNLKERVFGRPTSKTQTQIPPGLINRALINMSYFEHRFLHHLPVPFGTSLIAVGERS